MDECYFCETIQGKTAMVPINAIHSDHFTAAWDHAPATPGHMLIMPKRHVQFMKDLNEDEQSTLLQTILKAKQYIDLTDLKAVYENMLLGEEDERFKVFMRHSLKKLETIDRKPDAYNDGLNDGPAAGQTVFHLHWHIMPRWDGDVEDPRGGIRHMFEGMGNYHTGIIKK